MCPQEGGIRDESSSYKQKHLDQISQHNLGKSNKTIFHMFGTKKIGKIKKFNRPSRSMIL